MEGGAGASKGAGGGSPTNDDRKQIQKKSEYTKGESLKEL